jgi:hypothetical protein
VNSSVSTRICRTTKYSLNRSINIDDLLVLLVARSGWDVLSPDFQFLEIKFEDGVTLSAHEPHHHTA